MKVYINSHLFHVEHPCALDKLPVITFEALNKEVVEMEYARKDFLKYFDLDTALKLERYLQELKIVP